jgi:hypothetical protein
MWLIYWALYGVAPWQIAQAGLAQHYELVTLQRRYLWWLPFNLLDLFLFAGPAVLFGFVSALVIAMRKWPLARYSSILAVALAAVLLLLALSGSVRGEAGRLWLIFMVLMAPLAGDRLRALAGGRLDGALLVALQLGLTMAIGLAWRPVMAVVVEPAAPEVAGPAPAITLGETFSEPGAVRAALTLHGYDLPSTVYSPAETVELRLVWSAERPTLRPYTVFTHLLSADGEIVAQQDNWPVQGQWPSTCWMPGVTVSDPYRITLPTDLRSGRYSLYVGLYDAATGDRLVTAGGLDAIRLASLTVR